LNFLAENNNQDDHNTDEDDYFLRKKLVGRCFTEEKNKISASTKHSD
jgi:hypothetical protein